MVVGISMKVVLAAVGLGIAALFLAFACSRLLYTHIHRRRSFVSLPSAPSPSSVASAAVHLDGTHGLHPAAVAAFPTRAFSRLSPDPTQCVVCLAEYEEKDVLRFLPYCGHNFHVACIDLWLRQHATCPVCRILLYNYPDGTCTTPSIPYALT